LNLYPCKNDVMRQHWAYTGLLLPASDSISPVLAQIVIFSGICAQNWSCLTEWFKDKELFTVIFPKIYFFLYIYGSYCKISTSDGLQLLSECWYCHRVHDIMHLEKSLNLTLDLKIHWIWYWPGKLTSQWKVSEKSFNKWTF